jgi:hypothetical protein
MLFPQHADDFDKIIPRKIWESIQKEARKNLDTKGGAHPAVIAHWQSIVDGVIPFGYRVDSDK